MSGAPGLPARLGLGALGVVVGLYGGWLLVSRQDTSQWLDAVVWLVAGAVLHDAVLAPLVIGLALAARGLPAAYRRASAIALVAIGSLSLLAVPVLGRFGARPDNPTLLDRPYLGSWLVLLAATVVAVLVVGYGGRRAGRSASASTGDADPGGVSGSGSNTRSG